MTITPTAQNHTPHHPCNRRQRRRLQRPRRTQNVSTIYTFNHRRATVRQRGTFQQLHQREMEHMPCTFEGLFGEEGVPHPIRIFTTIFDFQESRWSRPAFAPIALLHAPQTFAGAARIRARTTKQTKSAARRAVHDDTIRYRTDQNNNRLSNP